MNDTANNVIDARLSEALGSYFNGVTLLKTVGDCSILSGVRKQNGAPVSIYTPSFSVSRDETIVAEMAKAFGAYDKIGNPHLQATERLLTNRSFKKMPALAVLSCPVAVFDEAFDTWTIDARLHLFDQVLNGLSALHAAGLVHGNLSADVVRRESDGGVPRLTDLTFSGDRSTTVTCQPVAYQSRNVINTTQPGPEDDVHAAGMLGYRILMGPDGPAHVLAGGAAEPETLVSAILGEEQSAPTAEELFPEGHEKAEQVARLLARMTGRLKNASPYSNAGAARRAFQTVLSGQAAPETMSPDPKVEPVAMYTQAPVPRSEGVSKSIALALFAGLLVSTGAACYFYLANQTSLSERDYVVARLKSDTARFAEIEKARQELRIADRTLASAIAAGAAKSSDQASALIEDARVALTNADEIIDQDSNSAADFAAKASSSATAAMSLLEEARARADQAHQRATTEHANRKRAYRPGASELLLGSAELANAEDAYNKGEFDRAAIYWEEASTLLSDLVTAARDGAESARTAFDTVRNGASDPAGVIVAKSYATRAGSAFESGQYSDAASLYLAAVSLIEAKPIAERGGVELEARVVKIGSSDQELDAAIALCREEAPIDPASCPAARPEGEHAREVELTPYALDMTEVSVAEFERFVAETGHVTEAENSGRIVALTSSGEARLIDGGYAWSAPEGAGSEAKPSRPVTIVSLNDARAYCAWADARLPTEAEWEAVAEGQVFPWGAWSATQPVWRGAPTADRRLPSDASAAGGATPGGHQGLSGNVREWVMGEAGAVLKGGSWNSANPADLRIAARLIVPGNAPGVDFGFRCARDLEAWQ
jgi:formylglycine-generating enzyme required for sulfatase activity